MKQAHSWSKPPDLPELIGRKKVDPSFIIHGDTTIPQEFHGDFDDANGGYHLDSGEGRPVTLEYEGQEYQATIRNADRGESYSDTYKLQFKSSGIFPLLQQELATSRKKLEEIRSANEDSDKKTYASLPDEEAEYVEFYRTGEPFRYRVEVMPKASANGPKSEGAFMDELKSVTREQLLFFPDEILLALRTGLSCQPFTLLAGPTGTGKTRLGIALGELDRYEVGVVEAEGGWLDSASAFGYISPTNQDFVPGPVLLRLLDLLPAHDEGSSTPVLLIDEINVSPPHVYLAPLLSALERARGQDEVVRLLVAQSGLSEESQEALREAETLHPRLHVTESGPFVRLELDIPPTLRVLGTLNFDASTEDLAPKVLSRSFVVWFEAPDITEDLVLEAQTSYGVGPTEDPKSALAKTLQDLSLRGYPISARTVARTDEALSAADSRQADLVDILLSGLVLPHLQTVMEGQDDRKFQETFLGSLPDGLFKKRLREMRQQLTTQGMANLWLVAQ